MKSLKTFLIVTIVVAGIAVSNKSVAQPGFRANVSFGIFYNELKPYGRWVTMPRYGQVWIYRDPNFRPYYTNGYWMDTELGWAWASQYPWGWAPFHYGRWEYDSRYGWFWIPGYEYAPAWVVWSQADDYYGWAPLGFGVDINISIGRIPSYRWMYAQSRYMGDHRIDRYCIPYQRNHYYYQRQQPVVNVNVYNNVRYDRGPRRDHRAYRDDRDGSRPEYRRREAPSREYTRQDNRRNGSVHSNQEVYRQSEQRRNNVTENKDAFKNKKENNPNRKFENPGHRNRLLKAEASR